jgi:hypothetical protein
MSQAKICKKYLINTMALQIEVPLLLLEVENI